MDLIICRPSANSPGRGVGCHPTTRECGAGGAGPRLAGRAKDPRLEGAQQDAVFLPLGGRIRVTSQALGPVY